MEAVVTFPDIADLILRPTGILLVAALLALLLRGGSAATRHLVWSSALCAALAVPLLGPVSPDVPLPMTAEVAALIDLDPPTRAGGGSGEAVREGTAASAPGAAASPPGAASSARVTTSESGAIAAGPHGLAILWRALWLAGCLGFLALLGGRLLILRRVERGARCVEKPDLLEMLASAKRRLGVDRPVRLLLGEPTAMPMTWGHRIPRILLPETAVDWPAAQTRAVLLHELAHVRRGDVLLQRVAELARAVFWFNPLAWFAVRRMLAEREHACDDAVIRSGVRGSEYAQQLLAMAHALRSARGVAAALPMARRSQMTGRLMAILDEGRSRGSPPARGASLVLVLGVAAGLAAAALRPTPLAATGPSAEPPPQEVVGVRQGGDTAPGAETPPIADSPSGTTRCWPASGSNTNSNRNREPGVVTAEWRTERCEGGLRIDGRAVVRSDLGGFSHLDPGARVKLGEKPHGGEWLEVELIGTPDGRIERRGLEGERELDPGEIDRWIASSLRPMLRLTGVRLEVDEGGP